MYSVPPYAIFLATLRALLMAAEKTIAVSFRVSRRFKALLETAAGRENRSQTNMVETLLFDYCSKHGIEARAGNSVARAKRKQASR